MDSLANSLAAVNIRPDPKKLQTFPTEIIQNIATFATRGAVLNLRATCHSMERQTFHYFCKSFKNRDLFLRLDSPSRNQWWTSDTRRWRSTTDQEIISGVHRIRDFAAFLQKYPNIAELITSLVISQHDGKDPGSEGQSVSLVDIFSKLPNLKLLLLRHFNSRGMHRYLNPTDLGRLRPPVLGQKYTVDHLWFSGHNGRASEVIDVIEAFSPRTLLVYMSPTGFPGAADRGFWARLVPVLEGIEEHLELFHIRGEVPQDWPRLDHRGGIYAWLGGEKGDFCYIGHDGATMRGKHEIEAGLSRIKLLIET